MQMIRRLWVEEDGYILSTELVLMGSLLVIGVVGGMTTMRDALIGEMSDLSASVSSLDQSFSVVGVTEGRDNLGRNDIAYAAGNFSGYGNYDSNGRVLSYTAGSAFLDNPEKDQVSRQISPVSAVPNGAMQTLSSVISPDARNQLETRIAARHANGDTVRK